LEKEVISSAIICILLASSLIFVAYANFGEGEEQKQFYVGVTYCGDNVQDAKLLIDKVANYTNLFVIQSGYSIIGNNSVVNEIGDYATSKGLHFAAASAYGITDATWISEAEQRWGNMFAGVYFEDEPGGKMLDGYQNFTSSLPNGQNISIFKTQEGTVYYNYETSTGGINEHFYSNGTITVNKFNSTMFTSRPTVNVTMVEYSLSNNTIYYPNGSIIMGEALIRITINASRSYSELIRLNVYTMENGSDVIAQLEPYQQVKDHNPISNCNTAATLYVDKTSDYVEGLIHQRNIAYRDFPIFTSDYALYWWDYQSGYDMVLAELAWNNSVAQEIGLVRGAANLQGKSWGTIITWKYTHAPYLTDGAEMFDQMKASYEAGAEYILVFNYAEDMSGPYGILQEEHFQALERFWNEVVQNPNVSPGSVKAEAVLVLPENYGWGLRNSEDVIWGIMEPNATSTQIWNQLQQKLDQYGLKLDIVYDDPSYTVAGKYANIYYWNQTT
jgi:hypothetical protein